MGMIKATDIDTLDSFKRNTKAHLARLKKSGDPCVLTVNGKGAVVIQDAAAYEEMMERIARHDRIDTVAALKEAVAQSDRGEGMSVSEAFRRIQTRSPKRRLDGRRVAS